MNIGGIDAREVPGLPGIFVTRTGAVWTCRPRNGKGESVALRPMATLTDKRGYLVVSFRHKPQKRFVHQLVLEAFVGPRPADHVTRYKDGVPANNALSNLEWATQKINHGDKIRHGTHNQGSAHRSAKLSEEQVIAIRAQCAEGSVSQTKVAARFGVSRQTVQRIAAQKRWGHV